MRKIFLLALLISSVATEAQAPLSCGFTGYHPLLPAYHIPDGPAARKWSLTPYGSISTGFIFLGSGSASFLAAPLGLQLNRRLNNNLYAFAGVSAAPTYINFNSSFLSPNLNKTGFFNYGRSGIYSRAELGLMYVNEERTFSISGSIGVERSSYPLFPYQQQPGTEKRVRSIGQSIK
jgi:hypothetical protein